MSQQDDSGCCETQHHARSRPGFSIKELVCNAGPGDRPFEQCHEQASIAVVTHGSFQYRSALGTTVLVPGAVLLGNQGAPYECRHDFCVGDRCIVFRYRPGFLEHIAEGIPSVRNVDFVDARLPPAKAVVPWTVAAETALARNPDPSAALATEEFAIRLAGAVLTSQAPGAAPPRAPTARDTRRISDVVRYVDDHQGDDLSLPALAAVAAMSPYHFVRTFRRVVGATPHQYVAGERLRAAARGLRTTDKPIADIAYAAGFGDLSNFIRAFRCVFGDPPSGYRRSASRLRARGAIAGH